MTIALDVIHAGVVLSGFIMFVGILINKGRKIINKDIMENLK